LTTLVVIMHIIALLWGCTSPSQMYRLEMKIKLNAAIK
jgi:hypothetical protein